MHVLKAVQSTDNSVNRRPIGLGLMEVIDKLNGTPTSCRSTDTPDDQSLSPNSTTPLSDADPESLAFTIGVTESTPYACQYCDKAFPRLNYLKRHEQVHSDHLPFNCQYCNRRFKHKRSRDRHLKLHTGDRKYRCDQCESAFSRSDHLKIHMKTHDNARPHQCTICNRGYSTTAALTSHMQNHKKNATNPSSPSSSVGGYRCLKCTSSFPTPQELQKHVAVHENSAKLPNEKFDPSFHLQFMAKSMENYNRHKAFIPSFATTEQSLKRSSSKDFLLLDTSLDVKKKRRKNPDTECVICKENFAPEALQQHIDEVHMKRSDSAESSTILPSSSSPTNDPRDSPDNQKIFSPLGNHYSCPYCSAFFGNLHSFQRHVKKHQYGAFYCPVCLENFSTELLLTTHLKSEHGTSLFDPNLGIISSRSKIPSPKSIFHPDFTSNNMVRYGSSNSQPLLCSQCNASFPDFESFRSHVNTHIESDSQKFSCFECDGQFPSEDVLNNHVVSHYLSMSTEYGCQSCPKMFEKPDQLQRHLMDIHAHQLYQCTLCKDMFQSKVEIQLHFSMKHSEQCRIFKCTPCNCSFQREDEFIHHVKITHFSKLQSYRSPDSSVCFPAPFLYQMHMQDHKKISCAFCSEYFPVEYLLERHMQEKHSGENILAVRERAQNLTLKNNLDSNDKFESESKKQLRCDMCDISFSVESSLIVHRRQVHNIKTSGSQKPGQTTLSLFCAYCNETCKSRTELENHMKSHTVNPSKHKCIICDEVCPSAGTLAEHKLEHCKVVTNSTCVVCHITIQQEEQFHSHTHQHNPQGLPAPCVICRQTLISEVEVQVHAKHHLRSVEFAHSCCVCGRKSLIQQLIITGTQDSHSYMCKDCFHAKGNDLRFSKEVDLKCQKCQVKFESILELESHKLCHPAIYQCIKCQLSFDTLDEIRLHVTDHVHEEGPDNICHLCTKIFYSPSKLQCHLIEHTYEGCSNYECYICKAVFATAPLIQLHMIEHDAESRPFVCGLCHQKFFFVAEYNNHSLYHQNLSKEASGFFCPICNLKFTTYKNYQTHCQIHENKSNYKCTLCPETFIAPSDLQQHHFKHHSDNELRGNKKTFPCNDCDQVFPCKSNLQGHQRIHSQGANYVCPTCNKAFTMSKNLTIHMRTHTGDKPYECPVCKMRFARKENRKAHLKSHTGKKPYLCPHCGKGFSRSCHAKEHIRIHATSTTYPCELCSETFPSTVELKNHLMSKHEKQFEHSCSVCSEVFEDNESLSQHMLKEHVVRTSSSSLIEDESESSLGQSSSSGDLKELDSSECSSNIEESDTRDSSLSITVDNEETTAPIAQTVT